MALAKKGTRLMTVEGERYRWVVAPDDEPGLGIVVEAADASGQRMVTWVDHGTTVSPWLVRETILRALAQGWSPRARGPERVFRLDKQSISLARSTWLRTRLDGLCDAFEGRVGVVSVLTVADKFETLCGRILDEKDTVGLSLAEFEQLAALGVELKCPFSWSNLIACLKSEDRERIPTHLRTLAREDVERELAWPSLSPPRREWLQRLHDLIVALGDGKRARDKAPRASPSS